MHPTKIKIYIYIYFIFKVILSKSVIYKKASAIYWHGKIAKYPLKYKRVVVKKCCSYKLLKSWMLP
jgi:hypothetical protein